MNQKSKKLAMTAAALATLLMAGCTTTESNEHERMGECLGITGETGPVKMSFDECMEKNGAFRDGFNMK